MIRSNGSLKQKKYLKTITELSKSDGSSVSLVEDDFNMLDFDAITKDLFSKQSLPTSADALHVSKSFVELVEFKTGFKQKITKDTRDKHKAKCDKIQTEDYICDEYWKCFFDRQDKERKLLIESIKFKAIDSYITLEKMLLPLCRDSDKTELTKLKFTVVIDENEIDNMENVLAELSGRKTTKNNCFTSIRNSLDRFKVQKDSDGVEYFYDEIRVVSSSEYKCSLRNL